MAFDFAAQDDYLVLNVHGPGTGQEKPTVDAEFQKQLNSTQKKFLVINCADCQEMSILFLRHLVQVQNKLKALNGKVCLIHPNKQITNEIMLGGLDRLLPTKDSLRGALVLFGLVTVKEFDVNFINPFINSTTRTLKIQCGIEATPQKPFVKKP